MKKEYQNQKLRQLTTISQLIERLKELPKDAPVVNFELKYLDRNGTSNRIEYK